MFGLFLDMFEYGNRIYAHGKWWTSVKHLSTIKGGEYDGATIYSATDRDELYFPMKIFVIIQTVEDKKHQEILFKDFGYKNKQLLKKMSEERSKDKKWNHG